MKRFLPPCYGPTQSFNLRNDYRRLAIYILCLTYFCYTSYHASRKPLSIVKTVLHSNTNGNPETSGFSSKGWKPFDSDNWSQLLGGLEYIYLFVYACSMILSGFLAERVNLRYFLSIGMFLSGISTFAFGLASYFQIHYYSYFVFIQVKIVRFSLLGVFWSCSSFWMASCRYFSRKLVGEKQVWFVKNLYLGRGLIMGLWNSHTSLGNIIGSIIAGYYVETNWGASFYLPGFIMMFGALIVFLTVIEHPNMVTSNSVGSDMTPQITVLRNISENVFTYSLLLFFAKLVSYTFLYWLPNYLTNVEHVSAEQAAKLSVLFDIGGIIGGVLIGWFSDTQLLAYRFMPTANSLMSLFILTCCGASINGPYALVTTAVSADLGTQSALQGRARALATITAIIDGMGSLGAALGPLLTGLLVPYGWSVVFAMLITSDLLAMFMSMWIVVNSHRHHRRIHHRVQSTTNLI
ncbi:Glucose-6-phosphate exchanger SLC37A2 [Schistosoma japonicum]|nr:Glucose-6-phosphate exchanger SLC37A2 [Schistosoma japonicum]KAH8851586.1 Glucose-6-phosphate exchanger SLC37A2 [Schistosoma japonicum]